MRMNIDFSQAQEKALLVLADKLNETKAGVLHKGLQLLATVQRECRDGAKLYVLDPDGNPIKEIVGLWMR